jgi:hypothetical protein
MATHHGVGILPARPYHPKDKAKVEAGVRIAQFYVLGRLRNMRFLSLTECNAAITEILVQLNGRVMPPRGQPARTAGHGQSIFQRGRPRTLLLRGDRHEQRQTGEPANQLGALRSVKQVSAKHRHFTNLHQLYPEIFRKGDDYRPAEDQNCRLWRLDAEHDGITAEAFSRIPTRRPRDLRKAMRSRVRRGVANQYISLATRRA